MQVKNTTTIRHLLFSVVCIQVTGIVSASAVSENNEEKVSISHNVININLVDTVHFRINFIKSTIMLSECNVCVGSWRQLSIYTYLHSIVTFEAEINPFITSIQTIFPTQVVDILLS